jgi:hypothetical protein
VIDLYTDCTVSVSTDHTDDNAENTVPREAVKSVSSVY